MLGGISAGELLFSLEMLPEAPSLAHTLVEIGYLTYCRLCGGPDWPQAHAAPQQHFPGWRRSLHGHGYVQVPSGFTHHSGCSPHITPLLGPSVYYLMIGRFFIGIGSGTTKRSVLQVNAIFITLQWMLFRLN